MSSEDKDRDDVMERLLELGGDKKYLTFDDLNRELPDNVVSPDDIEDVLQKLEGSNIPVADSDERLLEQVAAVAVDEEEVTNLRQALRMGLSTKRASAAVNASSKMMSQNTGSQLPVTSCIHAAAGPPSTEPTPCAM